MPCYELIWTRTNRNLVYTIDKFDRVIELDGVPQSSVGSPRPILLCDERRLLLAYILEDEPIDWDNLPDLPDEPDLGESIALVEIEAYKSFRFGGPNDETIHGHPLWSRGLRPYGAFRVEKSSWIRSLEKINSVHDRHNPKYYDDLRHLIFTFHDSMFECAATGFQISEHHGTSEDILELMQSRLRLEIV